MLKKKPYEGEDEICVKVFLFFLFLTSSCWFNQVTAASQHLKELVSLTGLFFKGKDW